MKHEEWLVGDILISAESCGDVDDAAYIEGEPVCILEISESGEFVKTINLRGAENGWSKKMFKWDMRGVTLDDYIRIHSL